MRHAEAPLVAPPEHSRFTIEHSSPSHPYLGQHLHASPILGTLYAKRVVPKAVTLDRGRKHVIWELSGGLGERNTQGIEVKRRGGVQAHHWVGSLKPLQDLHHASEAL